MARKRRIGFTEAERELEKLEARIAKLEREKKEAVNWAVGLETAVINFNREVQSCGLTQGDLPLSVILKLRELNELCN